MKRNLLFLLALGVFLASVAVTSNLMAQGTNGTAPPANQPATANTQAASVAQKPQIPVAVIDYLYLMEIHPLLHVETNKLILRKKQANEKVQNDNDQFQKLQRELQAITPGSPQYSAKMEEIRVLQANAQLRSIKENEEIELNALQFQYNAYMEIKSMVEFFAKNNNITVVINNTDIYRRLPAERSTQTMEIEMSQMQGIVWYVPGLDITQHIEKMLNDNYKPKGYEAVNYEKLKEQMFGSPRGGNGQLPTGVAVNPNQSRPQ